MTYLITLILSASSIMAAPVEMSFPEFSDKVRNQGTQDNNAPSEKCSVQKDSRGQVQNLTCGTDSDESKETNARNRAMDDESSDYARDMIRKNSRR